ncbi:MAG: hypothetical protein RJA22_1916 [Verrucomicrobiota bacterium]
MYSCIVELNSFPTMKAPLFPLLLAVTALAAAPLAGVAADKKQVKPYPLTTCVVSDEKLGADPSMKPYTFVHEGQEVKLCCKPCLKKFNQDTAKYLAKIEAGRKKDAK